MGYDDTARSEFLNKRQAKCLEPEQLDQLGPVIGRGAVWLENQVAAGETSDPYLVSGFATHSVHLANNPKTTFTFEVDTLGNGE